EPGQREKPNGPRNASGMASDIRPASAPLPEVHERGRAPLASHPFLRLRAGVQRRLVGQRDRQAPRRAPGDKSVKHTRAPTDKPTTTASPATAARATRGPIVVTPRAWFP